ncbi:MAG: dipeptide epimerase [Rhodospirillales bacterium]|nr:dipeptide epimerase [Rhodospirillales bacterium]
MPRRLTVRTETWPLREPFAISRGVKTAAEVVVAEIADGAVVGRGEGVPYPRYGETVAGVGDEVRSQEAAIAQGLDRVDLAQAMPAGAARNALDCALWDLEAKRAGKPVWMLAGLPRPTSVPTFDTIGLDTPEAMAAMATRKSAWPLLKIKLGRDQILDRVRAVKSAAPRARLIVDPNEAWTIDDLKTIAPDLARLGVEMIEQPVSAKDDAGLAGYASPVALCADEACHTVDDVARLKGRYSVVNIKLDKTGGLTGALDLAVVAKAAGFRLMVGCMVSTSLSIAPALLVAGDAAFVDLDGPRWLTKDREAGLRFADGAVAPAEAALWG